MSIDRIQHVEKFNPYHGKDGRFSSKGGGGTAAGSTAGGGGNSDEEYDYPAGTYADGANDAVMSSKNYVGDREIEAQANDNLRYHLGEGEEYASVERFQIIQYPTKSGMADVDVEYSVDVKIPNGDGTYERDTEYRTTTLQLKVVNKSIDTINHVEKNVDHIEHVEKNIDHIEEVQKYNHYHGKDGRFTSKNGAGAGAASGGGAGTKASEMDYNKIDDNKEYQVSGWSKDGKTITTTGVGVKQIIDLAGLQGNGDKVTIKEKGSGTLDNLKGVANKDVPGKKVKTVNGGGTVTMGERAAYDSFGADKIKIGTEYAISNIARGTVRVGTYNGPKHSSTGGSYSFTGRDGKKFGVDYDNTHMNPIYNVK